jgi:hypothetical protein
MKAKILFTKSPTLVCSFVCTTLLLLLVQTWTIAQTFPGLTTNTAGNNIIPSTGTGGCGIAPQSTGGTIYNNTVAGLAAGAVVNKVTINITHTWDADLEFYLQRCWLVRTPLRCRWRTSGRRIVQQWAVLLSLGD